MYKENVLNFLVVKLDLNKRTTQSFRCRPTEGHASLLFAHKSDIRRVALDRGGDLTSIVNGTR